MTAQVTRRRGNETLCRLGFVRYAGSFVGAWLSLVERSVRDREVGGSNPLAPTNSINSLRPPAFGGRISFVDKLNWSSVTLELNDANVAHHCFQILVRISDIIVSASLASVRDYSKQLLRSTILDLEIAKERNLSLG